MPQCAVKKLNGARLLRQGVLMSTTELQTSRSLQASRTPLPSKTTSQEGTASRCKSIPGSDVARQRAWLVEIEADDFYANVPCTD